MQQYNKIVATGHKKADTKTASAQPDGHSNRAQKKGVI